jgi:hypothetical protein
MITPSEAIYLLFYLHVFVLNPAHDAVKTNLYKILIPHTKQGIKVAASLLISAAITVWWGKTWLPLYMAIIYPALRWWWHDYGYAKLSGKAGNYIGTKKTQNAKTDNFINKKPQLQYIYKIIFLIFSLTINLFIYLKLGRNF